MPATHVATRQAFPGSWQSVASMQPTHIPAPSHLSPAPQGVWMAVGLSVGTIGVIAAARLLRSQLFGVEQFDPIAIGVAVCTLLVCAGVALLVPVRRATRVDPITVLR